MATVTAIIPTYNRSGTILRAIESVLRQTVPADQVIVVDDGSTDGTELAVARFGDRIQYVKQRNQGQAVARNLGVSLARGHLIAFLDSDDWWHPTKLAKQVPHMANLDIDVCFHDFSLEDPASGTKISSWNARCGELGCTSLPSDRITDPVGVVTRNADILFTSTLLIKRQTFLNSGGYNAEFRRCQDVDLHLRLTQTAQFGFLDECLAGKEDNQGVPSEMTYRMRIRLLRENLDRAMASDRTSAAHTIRSALVQSLRALAGHYRRTGKLALAVKTYMQWASMQAGVKCDWRNA